jgi:hypothetical protein
MTTYYFRFNGHVKTKQNLRSENDDADLGGWNIGPWPKDTVKPVTEALAQVLRSYNGTDSTVFEEVADLEGSPLPGGAPKSTQKKAPPKPAAVKETDSNGN